MELLGIEIPFEEFDRLICEQNKGKELSVETTIVNGEEVKRVVSKEHQPTTKELVEQNIILLEKWFAEYDNQVKQYQRCQRLGIEFDKDINELDKQAKENAEKITELRK